MYSKPKDPSPDNYEYAPASPKAAPHIDIVTSPLGQSRAEPAGEQTLLERARGVWEEHKLKIVLAVVALAVVYLVFIRTGLLSHALSGIQDKLEVLNQRHGFLVAVILFAIVMVVTCTMVFSHAAICILAAGVLGNFWLAVFILLLASLTASALIYFLARPLCAEFILSKISHMDFYQVLQKESTVNPWPTAFATRFLFIPAGSKDYILTMIDNPPVPFFVSSLVIHLFYITESCLIAGQIRSAGPDHKGWAEQSGLERFFTVMIYLIIVFTIVFIVYIGRYVTRKIEEKKRQMQEVEMTEKLLVKP